MAISEGNQENLNSHVASTPTYVTEVVFTYEHLPLSLVLFEIQYKTDTFVGVVSGSLAY